MEIHRNGLVRKFIYGTLLAAALTVLFLFQGWDHAPVAHAQGNPTPGPNTAYFLKKTIQLSNGKSLVQFLIKGPPKPPNGYEIERKSAQLPPPSIQTSIHSLTVPAYNWVFGCSAVSGGMIAAYYDRNDYPNMYTGPTDGGVMPLNNSVWGTWSDGLSTYPNIPLTASHQGVDGRATKGSIDDYWVSYGSGASDPYITGGWTPHTWGDAIGDYMKTSQSVYGYTDGGTAFYGWGGTSNARLTCAELESYGVSAQDGTYGRKLFYEARGYTVTDCYSQSTDNIIAGGFSLAQYKAEIDAGRPVMINLEGHTIVGVGYDDASSTIYIHDTWDYLDHSMPWGGSYSGLGMLSVSIVNLQPPTPSDAFNKVSPSHGATGQNTDLTLQWQASTGASAYEYCYDTSNNHSCTGWKDNGTDTSLSLYSLDPNTTYYWQVRAIHGASTVYANGGAAADWSFTTGTNSNDLFEPYEVIPISMAEAVVVGDFNHDGLNDVALTIESISAEDYLNIYLQQEDGHLAAPVSYATGQRPEAIAAGDLNNDGRDDVVVTDITSGTIMVYLQQGDGTMSPLVTYTTGAGPSAVAVGDITGDGLDDVVVSNWSSAFISVFKQNNSGTLNARVDYTASAAGYDDIDIGDLNNDGLNDVVKMNGQGLSPNLYVYLQTGSGTLAAPVTYSVTGHPLGNGVAAGDVTGDGRDDVVMSYGGNSSTAYVAVFAQNDGGTLQSPVSYSAYDIPGSVELEDENFDGLVDVMVVHDTWKKMTLYPQHAGGTLGSYIGYALPSNGHYRPQGFDLGDVNNDGLPDAIIADSYNGLVILYHQPQSVTFSKMSPANGAGGISTSPSLSWEAINGAVGYEYCLYTTSSNACNSAWSSAGSATSLDLHDLTENTTYHWQVRAIKAHAEVYANNGTWWTFTTANPCYTLTRSHNGMGSDPTASPPNANGCPTGQYHTGDSISLLANASTGWHVFSWSGTTNDASTASTNTTTMLNGGRTVTVNYLRSVYTLNVSRNNAAGGTVTSNLAGINCGPDCSEGYSYETIVTLTAAPSLGWSFTGWSGVSCPGTGTCTLMITANTEVTANFSQVDYTLSVTSAHGTVIKNPNYASYHYNDVVSLTATPAVGWVFANWSGAVSGTANPIDVTILGNTTVTANYTQIEYTLTVTSAHGTVTKTPDQATYHYGDAVQLHAAASPGWTFANWSGGLTGSTNPQTITIYGNTFVTANYTQNEYSLTVTSAHGTVTKSPNQATYHYNDVVQLTVASSTGWTFANWSGGLTGTTNPGSVTIQGNTSVTANYTQNEYSLSVTSAHGTVTKSPDQATFHYNDVVRLTATPATGWVFSNWSGGFSGTANPLDVTIHGSASITANYTPIEYTLNVTSVHGTVTKTPNQATYHYNDVVQLTAASSTGWTFANWSGGLTGTTNPGSVTILGNTSVTANYTQNEYTLTIVSAHGTVTRSPDQATYHYNDIVRLTATSDPGWTFANWSGGSSGTANPLDVTIHSSASITANYTQNEYNLAILSSHGTVTRNPSQPTYHYNDSVELTAAADVGWSFASWSGGLTGSANPGSVTILGNTSVTANYTQNEYSLTVTAAHGTVTKSPNQATYHYNDVVLLTASADHGWTFANWSGGLTGSTNPTSITIHGNTSVTANYIQAEYSLTVTSAHGTVTKSPSQSTYHEGDVVQLTATASAGWTFTNWSGALTSPDNPASVTIHGNTAVTANYTKLQLTLSGNTGVGDVTLTYDGGQVVSGSDGSYIITVNAGWTGSVTPSKAGYIFSPRKRTYMNPLTMDQTGQDYTALFGVYLPFIIR